MKKTFLIFSIIVASIPCSAQWKNAKFGDQILAFGVHDTSFFVGSVPYSPVDPLVFRFDSTNPSLWDNVGGGIDRTQGNITSFASLGNYFFAGMTNGSGPTAGWMSTNNGSSWTNNGGGCMFSNGTYLFGSSTSTLYRSKDTGTSWLAVACPTAESMASIGAYIFALTSNGIWRSTDSGTHWTQITPLITGPITVMGSLLFIPGNGELAESTDNGTQWTTVAVDSAGVPKNVQCLATDGKNLFAGTATGILVSTDTGRDWQAQNDSLTYKDIAAIAVFDTLLFIDVSNIGLNSEFAAYYRPISELTKPDSPASVVQLQSSDSLSIYPNPASGIVTIVAGNISIQQIRVLNVLGEEVLSVPDFHESEINLDISKLPSGTYFMQIETTNGIILRKIVKEE